MGVVGSIVVGLSFLSSFSGTGSFFFLGSSSSVGSDLGLESGDEVLERVELSDAVSVVVVQRADLTVVPAKMSVSESV